MKKDIIQPTQITMARYEYSRPEKILMYHIIDYYQKAMNKEIDLNRSLFGDNYIVIPFKDVDPEEHYHQYKKACDALRAKPIRINYIDEDGKKAYWTGGIINWGDVKKGKVTISIHDNIAIPLCNTALGYTAYSTVILNTLKSVYSMRFYEYCCRFKDTGHWRNVTPNTLRDMLGLNEIKSYQQYKKLKQAVIDVAQKELETLYNAGQCDIMFTYTEKKGGGLRKNAVTEIDFTIFWNKKGERNNETAPSKPEDYYFLLNFLKNHFNRDEKYREKVLNYADSSGFLKHFAEIVEIAEKKDNPPAYFRTSVKNEFPNFK